MQQHCLLTSGTASCTRPPTRRNTVLTFQRSFRSFNRSCTGSKRSIQCSYKPETQRQSQNVPAPPVKASPPPPPPPPPPPIATEGPSRRTIGLLLLAGSLVSYALKKSQEPQFYRDKAGIRYLKTDKGNPVAVTTDDRGNIMMVDPAGNLYYDTGSPQLGIYMVGSLPHLVPKTWCTGIFQEHPATEDTFPEYTCACLRLCSARCDQATTRLTL
ncbi:hypothetical protein ABBQ32_014032 [Trebouxia sp. C0010 RCD-2024]